VLRDTSPTSGFPVQGGAVVVVVVPVLVVVVVPVLVVVVVPAVVLNVVVVVDTGADPDCPFTISTKIKRYLHRDWLPKNCTNNYVLIMSKMSSPAIFRTCPVGTSPDGMSMMSSPAICWTRAVPHLME
jgi:hypothetical protein